MKKTLGRIVGIIVVLFVVTMGIFPETFRNLVDALSFPWAHSFMGGPTLTGRWRGQVNFEGQASRVLTMEIERNTMAVLRVEATSDVGNVVVKEQTKTLGAFTGRAEMPDENANIVHYGLSGGANRSGSQVQIKFIAIGVEPSSKRQTILQDLYGSWKGTTLELSEKNPTMKSFYDSIGPKLKALEETLPVTVVMTRQ
ncbi:MAG: hypothetical protein ACRD82_19325 [Blastocatellia bacterium]